MHYTKKGLERVGLYYTKRGWDCIVNHHHHRPELVKASIIPTLAMKCIRRLDLIIYTTGISTFVVDEKVVADNKDTLSFYLIAILLFYLNELWNG